MTLANAAVSPIILPFALWWCIVSWVMWRHHLLYVFERSQESGGMVRVLDLVPRPCLHAMGVGCWGMRMTSCKLTGAAVVAQMWHQIFTKLIWCFFIFGEFTGERVHPHCSAVPQFTYQHSPAQ